VDDIGGPIGRLVRCADAAYLELTDKEKGPEKEKVQDKSVNRPLVTNVRLSDWESLEADRRYSKLLNDFMSAFYEYFDSV
jgi:hypothetical protein